MIALLHYLLFSPVPNQWYAEVWNDATEEYLGRSPVYGSEEEVEAWVRDNHGDAERVW